jgi:hypothetical protein
MYNQSNAITCLKPTTTIPTMAASTFIKIMVEMLKNSKIIDFKEKIIVKEKNLIFKNRSLQI